MYAATSLTDLRPFPTVGVGDMLFAHVYLDPHNPPRQIMLRWQSQSFDHGAFWG